MWAPKLQQGADESIDLVPRRLVEMQVLGKPVLLKVAHYIPHRCPAILVHMPVYPKHTATRHAGPKERRRLAPLGNTFDRHTA
jgi:hypothetical protein